MISIDSIDSNLIKLSHCFSVDLDTICGNIGDWCEILGVECLLKEFVVVVRSKEG